MVIDKQVKTAGAYVWYDGYFPFQFGPTKAGSHLGVVRFSGHRENDETAWETAVREVREESMMEINIIHSPKTFLLTAWEKRPIEVKIDDGISPILIKGQPDETLSIMFLAYSANPPQPSSETKGILLLTPDDIQLICTHEITLKEFLERNGKAMYTDTLNEDLILLPYPQLVFLSQLLNNEVKMMQNFMGSRYR